MREGRDKRYYEEERYMKKIIITGPTGAIGNALIRLYLEQGYKVFAIVKPGSVRVNVLPKSERLIVVECDMTFYDRLLSLQELYDAESWIHLAWAGTVGEARNDCKIQRLNVDCAVKAAQTAIEMSCKSFVFAGSQAEYGRVEGKLNKDVIPQPESQYGVAKLEAGRQTMELCKLANVKHIYCRILSVYGPYDGPNSMISATIRKLLCGETPLFTPAQQLWDYMYSGDAAKAISFLVQSGKTGTIYCLGSGIARPLEEYIHIIGSIVNPNAKLGIGELPYSDNQIMYLCADIEDLMKDTGYVPNTSFETGIQETLKVFMC